MDELYARLGRKQVELDALREQYQILLVQIQQIKDGNLKPNDITVDLGALSWRIDRKETPAAGPPLALTPEVNTDG